MSSPRDPSGHACGRGCNGDKHAELIAEPGALDFNTLQRWLGAREVTVFPVDLYLGGQMKYAIVVWRP